MKIKSWSLACGILALSGGSIAIAEGCGGSSDDTVGSVTGDAATEGSTDDGTAPMTDAGVAETAPVEAGGDPYCAAVIAHAEKCDASVPCATAYCPQLEGIYNATGLSAEAQCLSLEVCGNAPAPGSDKDYRDCLAPKFPAPDTADQKLATDLCGTCRPGHSECAAKIYEIPSDGGARGAGVNLLQLSDTLIAAIDSKCTSAADAGDAGDGVQCAADFDKCSAKVIADALLPPPAACNDN
jgi:hypothetical protein